MSDSAQDATTVVSPTLPHETSCRVFVSHTGQDPEAAQFASLLAWRLDGAGISSFFDAKNLNPGDIWKDKIERNVTDCEIFVCVISPTFWFRYWCNRELDLATSLGKAKVPILVDCEMQNPSNDTFRQDFCDKHSSRVDEAVIDRWLSNIVSLGEVQAFRHIVTGKDSLRLNIETVAVRIETMLKTDSTGMMGATATVGGLKGSQHGVSPSQSADLIEGGLTGKQDPEDSEDVVSPSESADLIEGGLTGQEDPEDSEDDFSPLESADLIEGGLTGQEDPEDPHAEKPSAEPVPTSLLRTRVKNARPFTKVLLGGVALLVVVAVAVGAALAAPSSGGGEGLSSEDVSDNTTLTATPPITILPITTTPIATPSPASVAPAPCGGSCPSNNNLICLLATNECCEECKRFTLFRIDTAGDGGGGNVDPTFYINGVELFNGEQDLPPHSQVDTSTLSPPHSVGNIRPTQSVPLRVFEKDIGCPVDCHDDSRTTVLASDWYDQQQTPYERNTFFDNWRFYYRIEAECCE